MPESEDDADWPVQAEMRVSDEAAVQVLWYPTKRAHLKPFIGQSAGLADAARALSIKKTTMSYWINRLLAVGLIRPRGTRLQPRHRVQLYRCVADRLLVSLKDAPLASHEALFDDTDSGWHPQTRLALARCIARQAPYLDLVIESAGPSGLVTEMLPRGAAAPPDNFIYYRGRMWLTAPERDQLRAELDALWDRYAALSDEAAKHEAVLVQMVAVPESLR